MRDSRIDKLADVLTRYSTALKPGQIVRIQGPIAAEPMIEATAEAAIRIGAHPMVRIAPESLREYMLKHGNEQQLKWVYPLAEQEVQTIDAHINFLAASNTRGSRRIDPARSAMMAQAQRPVRKIFFERAAKEELRWCLTLFPTHAHAQEARMSLDEYVDFVFSAGHLNDDDPVAFWSEFEKAQQRMADYLTGKKILHFQADNGTDLTVNVEGMKWIPCSGEYNFPDGEVFTGPNLQAADGGVNGYVKYHFPGMAYGHEVRDIELWFEKGRVVKAKATTGETQLLKSLDQDEQARNLGEIAIGTNYNITEHTFNTLFDEKIGGTFHAAVGAGYPETGNTNESALHWDMICDLRSGGTITVDGEVISKNGQFVFDDWPQPVQ